MNSFIKFLFPLFLTEMYLIATLLLFTFGPIEYYLVNPNAFWFYICLYHIGMILGYLIGIFPITHFNCLKTETITLRISEIRVLIFLAYIAFFIGHKNLTMADSLIPYNFLSEIFSGIFDSHEQYVLKITRLEEYSGDKLLNIINFFVAFAKILIIPVLIFYWSELKLLDKSLILLVSFLPVLSGISTGTNKPLFDFVILYTASLSLYFLANYLKTRRFNFRSRYFFIFLTAALLITFFLFFGSAMMGRGGDPIYVESTSPLGHITLNYIYKSGQEISFIQFTYIWLSNYLVQGYYGFSLSLMTDFTSTYGLGGSQFLARQFEWVSGQDISKLTYQHKISSVWDEAAQWHSLYSHIANDIHFIGVIVWNFLFGLFMAKIWKSFIINDNLYSKFLLPLIAILVIFIPANNQVFGYLETFSAFIFLSALWFRSFFIKKYI